MAIKWLLDVIIPLLLYGLCYGFDASWIKKTHGISD